MDDAQLAAVIEQEISTSIGSHSGDLAAERALELSYYNSELFGNEIEGESTVVSSDVFDIVEGMLPSLLRIFTASDDVVHFEANGPEDEQKAKQRTELCNYVFYRQNNGFLILYEWFKDALINKNGVVKYWWDEKIEKAKETYQGLSEGQYLTLKNDKNVEIISVEEVPDEEEIQMRQEKIKTIIQMAGQRAQQENLPPEAVDQLKMQVQQQMASMPKPVLYNLEIRVVKDKSKVCIETVPPEEFFVSARTRCVSIQETDFCAHKRTMTVSELRSMGCPEWILESIGSSGERDFSEETLARDRFTDEWKRQGERVPASDPALREAWVSDCYIRIDFDEDGISELRHIIKVGREIWINEECDHIGFAALTPIIMPHRWLGKSAAELAMADQFTKSTILRQMLNNLYLTNNPRKAVLSSPSGVMQANIDDLMTTRPGGIVREYVPNAIRNEEIPFVAGASFPMLEYIDSQKEVRTGQTRYSQGTDADSLNKTAHGIQMIQQAGQQRGDLIARIFAETGVKDLMQGIAYTLSKYSTKAMTIRLRNKWVEIDPREWKDQYDMIINVGLGTGNKDIQLAHLERMGARQIELLSNGKGYMVTDQNLYNLDTKRAEAMGFKHPEMFISDPASVKPPPPPPNPDLIKIQTEAQIDQAKIQSNEKQRALDAQVQKSLAEINAQTQIYITQLNNQAKEQIEKMKIAADAQNAVFSANQQAGIKQLDHQHEMTLAEREVREAKTEGVSYDKETGYAGKVMAVKQDADRVLGEHSAALISQNDARQAQHTQVMAQTVGAVGQQLASSLGQFAQMLSGIQRLLAEKQKAKVINISNVKKDDRGNITGATIN
jgi:hypothetical protein